MTRLTKQDYDDLGYIPGLPYREVDCSMCGKSCRPSAQKNLDGMLVDGTEICNDCYEKLPNKISTLIMEMLELYSMRVRYKIRKLLK